MQYSDLITQESEYTYSANIQFDIENDTKLRRFIPNETTIELLKEYFIDIIRPQPINHARILYGSYGTGKSHFLTVLSLLLGKMHTGGKAYQTFISRINSFDNGLANDINAFEKNCKPYLMVPIVFDFDDFERCVNFSLRRSLEKNKMSVNFKSFFTYASSLIVKWKSQPDSKDRLEEACKTHNINLEKIESGLIGFDIRMEAPFKKIFSTMTYGVEFFYENGSLADALDQASVAISGRFSGIVFIFDEFGRYLEDNMKKIKVKAVQDLAEYCDHCNNNTHIILVSHKELSLYTQGLDKASANEWKKVEGRYKATPINNRQDQCLSLVKNILSKNTKVWNDFQKRFENDLDKFYNNALDFNGFMVDRNSVENPFEGSFPIHPITLYALDKLSKKVAQNERTFFTYLAGKEEFSLCEFLTRNNLNEFHYVGLDEIYNYFEANIKSIQSDASFVWYRKLQLALSKGHFPDSAHEIKILKALVVIGIVNDTRVLRATKKVLLNIIDAPNEDLEKAIVSLSDKKLIKFSGHYDRYEFFDGSIFDIEKLVADEQENINDEMVEKTLNSEFVDFVVYPYEYNDSYKIKRVFIPVFVSIEEISKKSFIKKMPQYYDGIIAFVFGNRDDIEAQIQNIPSAIRLIAVIDNDCTEIIYEVKRYMAICGLELQKLKYVDKDPAFEDEIEYYKSEQREAVLRLVFAWRTLAKDTIIVVSDGKLLSDCVTFEDLSTKATNLMKRSFPETLIVNNELLNKNILSGTINAAKKVAIRAILKNEDPEEYYGLTYLSPEYICVRSLLAKNALYHVENIIETNRFKNGKLSSSYLKGVIDKFIQSCLNAPTPMQELYEELRKPPLGLREGYISLLLAYEFQKYKKSIIISSHNIEQEISIELFDELVKRSFDYTIYISVWSEDQNQFVDLLEKLFIDYLNPNARAKNRLKALYDAMFMHYKGVSKFARTTEVYASDIAKKYRKMLEKTSTNYTKFFFEVLIKLSNNYYSAYEAVKNIKNELNSIPDQLCSELTRQIYEVILSRVPSASLGKSLIEHYNNNWNSKRQKSFDYYTNAWLDTISNMNSDISDNELLIMLSKILTGFEFYYWNDSHQYEFINRIKEINSKLDSYEKIETLDLNETCLTLVSHDGNGKSVVFDTTELSTISKTMKNKIHATLGNFGQSVSYEEKIQVLVSLLKDLVEGI